MHALAEMKPIAVDCFDAGPIHRLRPKVLFVIDTLETGGSERSLLENLSRFTKTAPVVCHIYEGNTLAPEFSLKGIAVRSLNIKKKYAFVAAVKKLSAVIKELQPSLIVACLTRSELVARVAGKRCGVPVIGNMVSDLYGTSYNRALSWKGRTGVAVFRLLNRATSGWCKGFIANSQAVKEANAKNLRVPLARIKVITRGRDSKRITFLQRPVSTGENMRLLNVGRLVPVKGQSVLLRAFKLFADRYSAAVLHIAGDGPLKAELQKQIAMLGLERNVVLLGNQNDVINLMEDYDGFISSSYSEGFSGAILEAMLKGLPVLATDIPANTELLMHLQTGYLFEAGSPGAMLNAMEWLMHHRESAAQIALNARHAAMKFDLDAVASEFENHLLQSINFRH